MTSQPHQRGRIPLERVSGSHVEPQGIGRSRQSAAAGDFAPRGENPPVPLVREHGVRRQFGVLEARALSVDQIENGSVEGGVSVTRGTGHISEVNTSRGVLQSGKRLTGVPCWYRYQCAESRDYATIPNQDTRSAARAPPIVYFPGHAPTLRKLMRIRSNI